MYTLEIRKGVLQRLLHNYSCVCVSVRRNSSLSYFSAHGTSVCVFVSLSGSLRGMIHWCNTFASSVTVRERRER